MPSVSEKQHKAMCAAAHAKKSKKGGIPKSIGKEYCEADKGGKFDKSKKGVKSHGKKR